MRLKWERWGKVGTYMVIIGFIGLFVSIFGFAIWTGVSEDSDLAYDFELREEQVLVTVHEDGGIDIDYQFTFVNYGPLDGVDVGLPNRHYDPDTAWAYVQVGNARYDPKEIRKSPYVPIGLAVEFTDGCRKVLERRGTEFTLRFFVHNPHMVYLNEKVDGTVGLEFRPTWFSPGFQRGVTGRLVVHMLLPAGHTDLNATYPIEDMPWNSSYVTTDDRLMLTWEFTNVDPASQREGGYYVGAAFPKEFVDVYYEEGAWESFKDAMSSAGELCLVAWPITLFAVFLAIFFTGLQVQSKVRKTEYFDPEMCSEGAGPRRDLTSVEAAVVLQVPMQRIAVMILYGLERKGLVRIDSLDEPLRLEKLDDVGEHRYETRYLSAVLHDGTISRKVLEKGLVKLVEDVEGKMEGFGLEATRDYYKAVVDRAWHQVESAGTPEEFSRLLGKEDEWLLIDDDFEDRLVGAYVAYPVPAEARAGGGMDVRSLARNYVVRFRSASSNLVDDMKSLSTHVTSVTHPPPAGGGGGIGGGGCACACACACAGGGR